MMKDVNVVMIPKPKKQSLHHIENQRGIFLISVYRSILMKLLLKDEYNTIDSFMSDSNVGGRKGRRAQDHIFIINGIIYDHARSNKKKQISICIYDCEQCFDSMWQDEVTNNLYDAGIKNDKLSLVQKINQVNKVAVKTPHGLSQRKTTEQIICQGEPWGPIECSLQIDGIGKESVDNSLEPYKYKDEVDIPALGFVDDIISISESGYKTARMNSFINAKLAMKKLRLGAKKCFVMHVGNEHESYKNDQLLIDGWNVKTVESVLTGEIDWEDTLVEDMNEISNITSEKYLGQILSNDSKNTLNITMLRNKGIGIQNKIIQMLEKMPGGQYHFEIAVILRNALLISSILTNSEVWYGVTQVDTEQLEQIDEMWIRNLFECSRNVPKDLLYLELGIVPISFIIKGRKQMFLHHILQQNQESLLYRFFNAQMNKPSNKDWVSTVLVDMEDLKIDLELEDMKKIPKSKFKEYINEKVRGAAFEYLLDKKLSRNSERAKGKLLEYCDFEMSEYLTPIDHDISIDDRKWLFQCRIEDIDLNINRKWNNESNECMKCPDTILDQRHLLECKYLIGKNKIISYIPTYEDLFRGDIEDQIYISRILKENLSILKAQTTM